MPPSEPARPIERLLIANRGEIAIRIARAARASGIAPLGIYSDADRNAMHLDAMDDVLRIGPGPASESYLDIGRVVDAARELRADAVHPGYGFLSERAAFAQAVIDAGLTFVGPAPSAIAAMGDKSEAKRRVRAAGVPVVPGYDGEDQGAGRLRLEAERIGVPVLIKASAGGGGRGMRVVEDMAHFDEALEAARREALGAFGDDRVLLEKYLIRPRHIEFQIVADIYGNTVHFGERECSIQRRHQKLIEEAPSLALGAALREAMGAAAVAAARSVGYTNLGTVEFLLDAAGDFYFLEMNARLQVEHPVTESVYGVDLVRLQLALAAGAPLEYRQDRITPHGWAIEARINAEDPQHDYLPVAGTITRWTLPPLRDVVAGTRSSGMHADETADRVRVDAGVRAGSSVSIFYDSLLAKVIVWGSDRNAAVAQLAHTLAATRIEGVPSNVPLLLRIVRDQDFRVGNTTTAFLADHPLALDMGTAPDGPLLVALGAVLADPRSWRVAGVGVPVRLRESGRDVAVTASRTDETAGTAAIASAGGAGASAAREGAAGRAVTDGSGPSPAQRWRLQGDYSGEVAFEVTTPLARPATQGGERGVPPLGERVVARTKDDRYAGRARVDPQGIDVIYNETAYRFAFAAPPALGVGGAQATSGADAVVSPMPGKIVKVAVRPGDRVAQRDLLVVLEAMKMEHRIEAAREGTVAAVKVELGTLVRGGATLVELAPG